MNTELRWNGNQNVRPATETNPGLRDDATDVDVYLQAIINEGQALLPITPDCCHSGIIPAMDTNEGLQRCDTCRVYDGEIEATQTLADRIGGVSIWFTGTGLALEEPVSAEHLIGDLDLV